MPKQICCQTTYCLAFGKWDALTSSLNPSEPVSANTHPCLCFTAEVRHVGARAVPLHSIISVFCHTGTIFSHLSITLCSPCEHTVSWGFIMQFQQIITRFCRFWLVVNFQILLIGWCFSFKLLTPPQMESVLYLINSFFYGHFLPQGLLFF